MAFSMYQSLKTIPSDLDEATRGFSPLRHGSASGGWTCRSPSPGLVWNMMMSMSGGWFMLVASEAVTVGNTTFQLPGIGSYIAVALEKRKTSMAVFFAILAMLVVILCLRPAAVPAARGLERKVPLRDDSDRARRAIHGCLRCCAEPDSCAYLSRAWSERAFFAVSGLGLRLPHAGSRRGSEQSAPSRTTDADLVRLHAGSDRLSGPPGMWSSRS